MPAPSNDNFASAQTLSTTLPNSIGGTTFDATQEGTEPETGQSVWFKFTAPASGWYKFWIHDSDATYHGTHGFDDRYYRLELFPDGALTAMTFANAIAYSWTDSTNHYDSELAAFLTNGATYYIRVSSPTPTNTHTVDFTLHWDAVDQPANDNLANVVDLGSMPVSKTGQTTYDATFETGEALATTLGGTGLDREQSVWYTFTPTVTGRHRFILNNLTWHGNKQIQGILQISTQSTLAGYTTANELGRIYLAPAAAQSVGYFDLVSGTTYYIRVSAPWGAKGGGGQYNGTSFDFDLSIEYLSAPANDDFGSAEVLSTTVPNTVTGDLYDATADATQDSSGSPLDPGDQTVWYSFTPTATGQYTFKIPLATLVYTGDSGPNNRELGIGVAEITSPANFTNANLVGGAGNWNWITAFDASDQVLLCELVAGHTYIICVWTDGTPYNAYTSQFDLEYDYIVPPSNDNFASATAISGASGSVTEDVVGATAEATEPLSVYRNADNTGQRSVWFDWTCPADGDYVFRVENTTDDPSSTEPKYDLAVWQGSALGSLTKIARGFVGTQNDEGRTRSPATAVGFHGTSGQSYKIQVVCNDLTLTQTKLSWRANTVTGDSTAGAIAFPDGRIDNYGNGVSEVPPDVVATLSAHPMWWFTDGQVGHVKWFKQDIAVDQTISVSGSQWDGMPTSGSPWYTSDLGLIVYKGADFASLVVAKQQNGIDDAAMMLDNSVPFIDGSYRFPLLTDQAQDKLAIQVDAVAGETVWIAVFGLYDADYAGSDAEDASQFELDLHAVTQPPENDDLFALPLTKAYRLDMSRWGDYYLYPPPAAGKVVGTTVSASSEIGEPQHAGFGPSQSVWYEIGVGIAGDWHFLVDSAQDCVLSVYKQTNYVLSSYADLQVVAEDDDSGPGSNPEITTFLDVGTYYVAIDSKEDAVFTFSYDRLSLGTPPANDDFANAEVVSSLPFTASGTTVGATAEPDEVDAEELGGGPGDSVWFKYVADHDGQLKIKATCDTFNDDAYVYIDTWHGTAVDTIVRHPDPPPTGPGGGIFRGFYSHFDSAEELDAAAIYLDIVNGETYYIRVQTESGGSEDFTIYIETATVYLNLSVGSDEHGPFSDFATVYLTLTPSGSDEFHGTIFDAGTVYLTLTPGATWETQGRETTDVATVRITLSVLGGECFGRFHFTGEGEAETRWATASVLTRWSGDAEPRWTSTIEIQPGC